MAKVKVNVPAERSVRLATGLILFSYAGSHFLSHATGSFLLDDMEAWGRGVLLAPWRTSIGRAVLLVCFLTHAALGLRALYRRRHLRMPALEAWQLGLGLLIPWLLIPHVSNVRLGYSLYGFDDSYFRIVYQYWLTQPLTGLPRQFALLLAVWIHGCIGIHMGFRFRAWYGKWRWGLLATAILIPVLAVIGIINAGWDSRLRRQLEPDFARLHGPPPAGTPEALAATDLANLWQYLQLAYIGLVAAILLLRMLRDWHERRTRGVEIAYAHGPKLVVRPGFSVLEASRWGGIPHVSVCGGRGRCSTCRVRVLRGLPHLPLPAAAESATLARIGAPVGVRLACQVRPEQDVTVQTIVPAGRPVLGLRLDVNEGRELMVTAMSVDLRDSTRLATGRLPFDVVFIVDRYVQAVSAAIEAHGGHVMSVAGDGIMSVFGLDGNAAKGAVQALAAAAAAWRAIDQVSALLHEEIGAALRFGIGVHTGVSVLGNLGLPGRASLQFLGDTGNVAARLEAMTKERQCTMIVSRAVIDAAGWPAPNWRADEVGIRGRDTGDLPVLLIYDSQELAAELTQA